MVRPGCAGTPRASHRITYCGGVGMADRIVCGTLAGHRRHLRRGEPTCAPCRAASAAYMRGSRATPRVARPCINCGEIFTPVRNRNAEACSKRCRNAYNARRRYQRLNPVEPRSCMYCETSFLPKHRDAEVCSRECRTALTRFKRYGLTLADYQAMLDRNGHCCEVCRKPLGHGPRDRHIDHCHSTGKVRGVLCPTCNLMLGHSQDSPEILRAGAEYLKKHI